ncbi:Translation initiation factor eIF2B subunit gamma [Caenorhabditis elegans]|uniref:Translation initiation factor eIF2B subunit gamma n=1 Tax=Caenorhabditis elegans TaxID=6239 RepID=EI2BG_CAEEL|nr:putative translation initiation factor eIF-2B subunit gamma [Caenorhabditis elegans]P80361.3 RecName: Full=Translation initiation factor eIF2B subunit gamma; AltName: Full=Putative pyrophosphorylase ppp-1; AltName: Full=eIF2B GDP-GTP exchange factor subunit gamma [Caenorhabditis elegans]CCD64613.1 Probable translation initiation factor eIF-2B subunit gamma [Caenorhabditis elegans]|eukprot:NP_495428.1 Probable translation initiation factor eIF-2B subunit gamma [Caenorhabditis elegans]
MHEMQGILLCSGGGTRMPVLTRHVQKCLLPVVGVPMFLYPLSSLLRTGITDIKIFVREVLQLTLEKEVKKSKLLEKYPAHIEYICVNQEDFGTADLLKNHHSKITKDALIVSCDFISDASLIPLVDFFRATNSTLVALIADTCVNAPAPGSKSKKPKATDVMAIVESTGQLAFLCGDDDFDAPLVMEKSLKIFPSIKLTSKYNDCHVYAIRHKVLLNLSKSKHISSFKADFVPLLIDKQFEPDSDIKCFAYRLPHENGFVTAHANTLGSYFEVNKAIQKSFTRLMEYRGNGKNFNYKTDKIAAHESRIEESAEIDKDSVIKRSFISDNCRIGEKTKLKESIIAKGVVIGNGASISNSIICDGVEIGENADVTNCIVAKDQKVPAKGKVQNEVVEDGEDEEWTDD